MSNDERHEIRPVFLKEFSSDIHSMIQSGPLEVTRRESMYLPAGVAAGVVAALGSVGVQLAMAVHIASLKEIAWSAFVAGVAGGLLYRVLAGVARRPILALWTVSLGIASELLESDGWPPATE